MRAGPQPSPSSVEEQAAPSRGPLSTLPSAGPLAKAGSWQEAWATHRMLPATRGPRGHWGMGVCMPGKWPLGGELEVAREGLARHFMGV